MINDDGIVIFTEGQNYINKVVSKGRSYALSIPLDEMKLYGAEKDDGSGLKQEILRSWNKYFELTKRDGYFVYELRNNPVALASENIKNMTSFFKWISLNKNSNKYDEIYNQGIKKGWVGIRYD